MFYENVFKNLHTGIFYKDKTIFLILPVQLTNVPILFLIQYEDYFQ